MKKSIVTIVAFMLFALAGFAQEKYEYAILSQDGILNVVLYTKDGDTVIKTYDKNTGLLLSLLSAVDELQDKGWEVYNSTTYGTSRTYHVYYLRKKKQ